MNHAFGCESDERKRAWIVANFPLLRSLFADVLHLGKPEAFNTIAKCDSPVPPTDLFICGFVCKSLSAENRERKP